ncbi:MAG: hypothetical protein JSW49_08900 [candidate division WOR-3 bacterium]|nr:MAG: hypothetical protein JSW49_08900 [candidate division WOR-3 bacterium]
MKVECVGSRNESSHSPSEKRGNRFFSLLLMLSRVCLTSIVFTLLVGCVPPFSAMQSAKLAGKGRIEVTPMFSTVLASFESTEHVQNEFGLQVAFGLADGVDLQLRYEFISFKVEDMSGSANVIGIGPKIRLIKDMVAVNLPIGFAFGGDIDDISDTWQFHPTLHFTLSAGSNFELNPSTKMLIPLGGDGDVLLAFNLGLGMSTDLRKWAIRPEAGFLINPGLDGHYTHFSIGLTIYP